MISNPLHRFSPYQTTSSSSPAATHTHNTDMDALVGTHSPRLARPGRPKSQQQQQQQPTGHRQGPYTTTRGGSAAGPVRRRISRACDQCNQLRTKCDGQHPCAHCIECGIGCDYARARKKRGKASRKDLAQQAAAAQAAAAAAAARGSDGNATDPTATTTTTTTTTGGSSISTADGSPNEGGDGSSDGDKTMSELMGDSVVVVRHSQRTGSMDSLGSMPGGGSMAGDLPADLSSDLSGSLGSIHHHHPALNQLDGAAGLDLDEYAAAAAAAAINNPYEQRHLMAPGGGPTNGLPHATYSQAPFSDLPYSTTTTTLPAHAHSPTDYGVDGTGFSPLSAYHHALAGTAAAGGAGDPVAAAAQPWMTMSPSPPPPRQMQQQQQQHQHAPAAPYHHPTPHNHPRNMSAAAAAAAAAAHMHRYNGVAMHNLHPVHPAVHPPLTGSSGSAKSSSTTSTTPGPSPRLRYPVLEPLVPHLGSIIPLSLACDLVDLYFSSSSSAPMHPTSPYVLSFFFRKRTFLHPTRPRVCTPALLASMLWVAAQTSDAPLIASVPAARGKICQRLLELTVSLLKPLVHALPPGASLEDMAAAQQPGPSKNNIDSATHYVGMMPPDTLSSSTMDSDAAAATGPADYDAVFGTAGTIDDVITYMHLATVVSASEYKGASLRWWNAAWCLARELKLGREVPADGDEILDPSDESSGKQHAPAGLTEEEREERRRIWWLIYMVDRHLALCYNRPLFLLDVECAGLKRPMDDDAWQNGDFSAGGEDSEASEEVDPDNTLYRGSSSYACDGHNIYGFFLPLMTILGEVVDLHHARNHPRFGLGCGFRTSQEWDAQIAEITHHLAIYEQSLKAFEQRVLSPAALVASHQASAAAAAAAAAASTDVASNHVAGADAAAGSIPHTPAMPPAPVQTMPPRMTAADIQTRIVCAYGTHVMHVLHILLAGKWDPVNLLDDNDLWISSQGFITATGHAVAAAEAISEILEYDPGLELMPFFFGIYLLQGSFLLLLIADKLQLEASASVVRACETIIRAHEACVVTLNTEYQRNFSRVMRSALAQARGRVPEDLGEQHMRRRELLSLYRWTGDGTGLAL